nr:DNA polymerase I [Psychromicrobium silvestre]
MLVLDGHSMAFRAFYALPPETFVIDTGQHTNAVHGFTSMLLTMIRQQKPTHVVVAFDLDTPTFRSEEYSEYKGGRNKTPEEFGGQIELITKVMEAMNVPTITLDGYEADDIIATLAAQAEAAGWETLVVSGDRDAFQLITEKTLVLYPKKGISDIPPLDATAIEEKYFVRPDQYSDLAALVGETADNLPGVPGVGPKTAAKWINQYGGLEAILANIDSIGGKVGDSLRENVENVKRNRRLNHLLRDLELPVPLEQMELKHPNREKIEELFDALQFKTLRKRLFEQFGEDEEDGPDPEHQLPEHTVLGTEQELAAWLSDAGTARVGLALVGDTLPVVDPVGLDITAVALSTEHKTAFVPLSSLDAAAEKVVADWLAGDAPKAVHDAKAAYKALSGRGLKLNGVVDDTSISSYLIQPERRNYELADLSLYYLKSHLGVGEGKPSGQLDLGLDDGAKEAVARAFATERLSAQLEPLLLERGADKLLGELELPLLGTLAEMELAGVAVSKEILDTLMTDFTATIDAAQAEAYGVIGHEVNLGSPKQLQTVLFEELGMPKTKKIKTGFSTDAEALADLMVKSPHPFLQQLQAYRDATKLRQTVEGLLKSIGPDERVHTTYAQNIAATGRLSSNNPNLQNIPIRSEEGRRIRSVFVVGKGAKGQQYETLLTADYSQIEMRIMAHLSGDEALIQAFKDGEDLHRFVGSHIFNVEPQDVTSAMRSKVKAMSYGLAYGLSSFGLSKQLSISVDEARTLMKDYFDRFGAVRDYLRGVVEQARLDGYTETIEGRRRYLPDLTSDNRHLREIAERVALNSPIQGSAADIIKRAMLGVDKALAEGGLKSRMLLQVHDELVLEVAPGELEQLQILVPEQMAGAAALSVPLDVQVGIGKSWFDAGH